MDGTIVAKLRVNINLRTATVDEIMLKYRTQFVHILEWYFEEVKNAELQFDPNTVFPSWLDDFTAFKELMLKECPSKFNVHSFYRTSIDKALDLKEGTIRKLYVIKLLGEIDPASTHNQQVFLDTVERVRKTHASRFADPKFVKRYMGIRGDESLSGNADESKKLQSYSMAWKLSLTKGAWVQLLRGDRMSCVRVATPRSKAQRLRNFIMGNEFIRGLIRQVLGFSMRDTLHGIDGEYCPVARMRDGRHFYQLSKKKGSLSSKFIYYTSNRWFVGSTVGSEFGDLRSATEDDAHPWEVRAWEVSTAAALWGHIYSSHGYKRDSKSRVTLIDSSSNSGVDTDHGEVMLFDLPAESLLLVALCLIVGVWVWVFVS